MPPRSQYRPRKMRRAREPIAAPSSAAPKLHDDAPRAGQKQLVCFAHARRDVGGRHRRKSSGESGEDSKTGTFGVPSAQTVNDAKKLYCGNAPSVPRSKVKVIGSSVPTSCQDSFLSALKRPWASSGLPGGACFQKHRGSSGHWALGTGGVDHHEDDLHSGCRRHLDRLHVVQFAANAKKVRSNGRLTRKPVFPYLSNPRQAAP